MTDKRPSVYSPAMPSQLGRAVLTALIAALAFAGTAGHAAADEAPRVRLIKPGTGAKKALRFTLTPGSKETMTARSTVTMTSIMNKTPITVEVPTVEMRFDVAIGKPDANQRTAYTSTVTAATVHNRAGVPKMTLDGLKKAIPKMVGLVASAAVDPRGVSTKVSYRHTDKNKSPMFITMARSSQEHLVQLTPLLPAQPVGTGAVWQVRRHLQERGIKAIQTTTYELVELADNRVVVKVRLSRQAPSQHVQVPGIKVAGKGPELLRYTALGTGTFTIDPRRLVSTIKLDLEADYTMRAMVAGKRQDVRSKIASKIEVGPSK